MKKKILVVDDSAPIRELSTTMLKLLGYEPIGDNGIVPPLPLLTSSAKAGAQRALGAVAAASNAAARKIR